VGLCLRRSTIWPEIKDVSIETRNEAIPLTIYHTPEGDVSSPMGAFEQDQRFFDGRD
jgi:hypothetical protein